MSRKEMCIDTYRKQGTRMREWAKENMLGIFIFNMVVLLIVLLRSVGYFAPYLPIGVNMVFLVALVMSVMIFKAGSRFIFLWGLGFWLVAGFFRVAGVEIWAERAAIYAYEAMVLGVVILIVEVIREKR